MEGKITVVTLVVTNQARSLAFFTEKVGFEKRTDVPAPAGGSRWVTVAPRSEPLELSLWEVGSATDPSQKEVAKSWAPGRAPPIVLRVSDCRQVYRDLSAKGVEFPLPPKEQPWGIVATFKDPDGNLFSISQPPSAWPRT